MMSFKKYAISAGNASYDFRQVRQSTRSESDVKEVTSMPLQKSQGRYVQDFDNLMDLQASFASSVSFKTTPHNDQLQDRKDKQTKKADIYGYNGDAHMTFSEGLTPKDILESQSSDPWRELDSHILSISNDIFDFEPKRLTAKGSKLFKTVLEDEKRRRKARREGFRKAMKLTRASLMVNEALQADSRTLESDSDSESETSTMKKKSRGWVMLRRFLQEQRLQKKLDASIGGWNLVSKTVQHLTDAESGRQKLYERYLEQPNSWREGLVSYDQYRYLFEDSGWKRRQRELLLNPRPGTMATEQHDRSVMLQAPRSRTAIPHFFPSANQKQGQSDCRKTTGRASANGKRMLQRPHTVCR